MGAPHLRVRIRRAVVGEAHGARQLRTAHHRLLQRVHPLLNVVPGPQRPVPARPTRPHLDIPGR
jgi:hypothetical protein